MDDKRKELLRLLREAGGAPQAPEGIAVIGLAGRYPGAATPEELWTRVHGGENCIGEFLPGRGHGQPETGADLPDRRWWAGLIDDADAFDPLFFGIAPVEAESMDPQERVFLETVWATLEDAGWPPGRLAEQSNPVGVFVGVMHSDYEWMGGRAAGLGVANSARSSHWSIANRVSYILDLRGPSLTVNTACSSSLTAVHLACESLRAGDCSTAIVGGVNLILDTSHLRTLSDAGMTSPGDSCRSFGLGADGFVDGEGVGAVLLKPLSRAVADGDRIHGVIRASAVNSGGKTGGYTVPSQQAQAEVITAGLRRAGIDPRTVGCVEAHGTGTPLGDPIEISGLVKAFRTRIDDGLEQGLARCAVGSVKSNIGHLESAAGIAGLTKVLMQLRHRTIAPSLHSAELNPDIDFADGPFYVPQEPEPWERPVVVRADGQRVELPRRAGISSFGGGGANAHLIVEEYLAADEAAPLPPRSGAGPELIVLSARDEVRLRESAARLADFLDTAGTAAPPPGGPAVRDTRVEAACLRLAAEALQVGADDLDPVTPLGEYGFRAAELTVLAEKLEAEFGRGPTPGLLTGGTTVRALSVLLADSGPEAEPSRILLRDVAHTLQTGRTPMAARLAFPAGDLAEAGALLRAFGAEGSAAGATTGRVAARYRPSEEDRERVSRAQRQRDLRTLAEHWTQGAEVDWSELRAEDTARRIGLPTYPFARKRYWLPEIPPRPERLPSDLAPITSARTGAEPSPMVCYRPTWVPAQRPAIARDEPTAGPLRVLILSSADAARLADGIAGHHRDDDVRLVDLDRDDLVAELAQAGPVDRVYHLGGIRLSASGGAGSLEDGYRRGILALFRTAGHLAAGDGRRVRLKVVTNDAVGAFDAPVTNPFAAGLHGLARVLPKETPELKTVCLDFAQRETADDAAWDRLLATVLAEPCDSSGRTVLLRYGTRYTTALEPVDLPEPQLPPFRDRGVYVIVGGAGGIGRELTLHLAERYRARVVWISRNALDADQRACADRARRLGGEVLHLRADCCDTEALRAAAAEVSARFGAVHGVIHAGMTFAPSPLSALDDEAFRAALMVKTDGSVAIDQVFGDQPLDFLAFFSSVGAFAGTAGNGAYSCAAALQDAYALHLGGRRGYPVRVVNWGYWGGIGSGARPGLREIFHGLGIGELSVADGLSAFHRILGNPLAQVMPISARDFALAALGTVSAPPAAPADGPSLARVAGELERSRAGRADDVDSVLTGHHRLAALCRPAVLGVFRRMGVLLDPGEGFDRRELPSSLGIQPKYQRLYGALLNILSNAGYVEFDGERCRLLPGAPTQNPSPEALDPEFDRIAADHPELAATVTLTRLFLRSYPQILRGEIRATEIMFPGSSMALVESFYKANALSDSFNELVGAAVRSYLGQRLARLAPGERLRVVELGAGTGATTETVLPVLAPHAGQVTYCFTDISPRFLENAEERLTGVFGDLGILEYQVLDLEKGIEAQGFTPGSYDMVLATNVVHATRDLRATLAKAKALLRPDGWLVLNELTEVWDHTTVVGGVLDGWWLFDDGELRLPDSPLTVPATWQRLLREGGFEQVVVADGRGPDSRPRGQHVIVAENGGRLGAEEAAVPQAGAAPVSSAPVPEPARTEQAPTEALTARLASIVARALKLDEAPDPDRALADYGFDSLTGMKIVSGITEEFGVTVSLGDFYEHPTLRELSRHYTDQEMFGPVPDAAPEPPPTVAPGPRPTPARAIGGPLSEGQRALWIVNRVAPDNAAYNVPLALWLDPQVDAEVLRGTLQDLVDRHEALRTTVTVENRQPAQHVAVRQEADLRHERLDSADEEALRERMRAERARPFDLAGGPLLRVTLYSLPDGRRALLAVVHHIVFDGVSIGVVLRELEDAYRARAAGRDWTPSPPAAGFADFVAWQRNLLAGPEGVRLRDYWLNRVAGPVPELSLPTDRPRPTEPRYLGGSVEGRIDAALVARARAFAAAERVSLFSVMLAGYYAVLRHYGDQDRILVGTPTAGRPGDRFDDTLGCFMNMVVIDGRVPLDHAFRSVVAEVHRDTLAALQHGEYPLITLIEQLRQAGRLTGPDLFRAAFYYQNWVRPQEHAGLVHGMVGGVHQEGEFDLTLEIVEGEGDFLFTVKYDRELFEPSTAAAIADRFVTVLTGLIEDPDRPVASAGSSRPAGRPVAGSLAQLRVRRPTMPRTGADEALIGQVEANLARLPGIRRMVVVAGEGEDGTILRGFYQADPGMPPDASLPELVRQLLPAHLHLDEIVLVDDFPRAADGGLDRQALAGLSGGPAARTDRTPRTPSPVTPSVPDPVQVAGEVPSGEAPSGEVAERLAEEVAAMVARAAGLTPEQIDPDIPFGQFKLDSIRFTELSLELSDLVGAEVLPTAFYRFPTLSRLLRHLADNHGAALGARYGGDDPAPAAPTPAASTPAGHADADRETDRRPETVTAAPAAGAAPAVPRSTDVAVVGMAARLPQSADLDAYWAHLLAGHDLIEEIPAERWDWRAYDGDSGTQEKSRSRWGGFVLDVDKFDAAFFGISPREAELMDPQQRLLLETVWAALENAAIPPSTLAGRRVGVFIGVTNSDYVDVQRAAGRATEGHTITGAALSVIPNRVSYLLDLRGPSMAVDTACSGSLTAVHHAVRALRDGECDLAIAGGVSLILSPNLYVALSKSEMLSPDGRCRTFDASANGYVRGEGVGVVVLKKLTEAVRDADPVDAVIKAAAVNHGGRTTSLTSPNPGAQTALLVEAYRGAGIDPATVGYIEAHGTGTALGDPIETAGLRDAFAELYGSAGLPVPESPTCAVGSVKTNIGHLEAAAGIAGLIKTVLAMRHRTIPASLHFQEQNPYLELAGSPLYVASQTTPWPHPVDAAGRPAPRRAGVSSFGFGGANAHVVLEEPEAPDTREELTGERLFVLSARTPEALRSSARRLADHLQEHEIRAGDLAYTLWAGRDPMTHRLAVVADSTSGVHAELDAYLDGRPSAVRTGRAERSPAARPAATRQDLATVAADWLRGAEVERPVPHAGEAVRRVHLPGHPFARIRHWIAPEPDPSTPGPVAALPHPGPPAAEIPAPPAAEPVAAFAPDWQPAPAIRRAEPASVLVLDAGSRGADLNAALAAAGLAARRIEVSAGFDAEAAVRALPAGPVHVVHVAGDHPESDDAVEYGFHAATAFLQAWQRERRGPLGYLFVHPDPAASPAQQAMAAFGRSVRLEHPLVDFGVLAVESGRLTDAVIAELGAEREAEVRVGAEGRMRRGWRQVSLPARAGSAFTGSGAHIVTGGTGALGLLLAEHIAAVRHTAGVSDGGIVLAARSVPGPEARDRALAIGADIVRADVGDPAEVRALIAGARRSHGSVSGVVHAAGVLRDGLLRGKERADAEVVLAAKVRGTVLLDEATLDEPLDYFVAFSSAAAVFGNVGQTDYAFANAFLDHFAEQRERQRRQGDRRGRTLAAAWPVWAEGAMRIDASAQEHMARTLGMRPVPTGPALDALERALAGDAPRLLLTPGSPERVLTALNGTSTHPKTATRPAEAPAGDVRDRAEHLVLRLLAAELKLPEREIALTEPFGDYGVDSLITLNLIRQLEEHVGPLSKTLLFEYVTVRELADHLAADHPDVFAAAGSPATAAAEPATEAVPAVRPGDDIAIIGVAGRYPEADDLDEFWRNLRAGRDSVEEVPADRWDHSRFYDADRSATGRTYGKWGGFVRDADRFDPLFFRMSRLDAEHTDPQERVFLETVWHLLEDAGCTRDRLSGTRTGVFVGLAYGHYQLYGVQDALRGNGLAPTSSYASVANRVSYFFDFTGPSVAVDTMCSSSLVAIHQACLAIRNGDCDTAVAGGVNISSHPVKYLQLAARGFLSEDGRCRSFGAGGTGYVPADGSGAVLLKRLDAALADGDRILAVVKGSAVNHGGAAKGFTAPSPRAQGDLLRAGLDRAGLRPADLDYLEAHGTGTALGDPIEVSGMLRAFHDDLPDRLPIGSVKSNIGHAEAAAGIAGVSKVLLQMRHGELVPSLHADRLNPDIDFAATPFRVQRELADWPRGVLPDGTAQPRTAGVSSFGAGGTNACLVLQEYLGEPRPQDVSAGPQLAVLSARDADRLTAQARRLAVHLRAEGAQAAPAEVAWTLQWGREAMEHRLAVVFHDLAELAERLEEFAAGAEPADSWTGVADLRRPLAAGPPADDLAGYAAAWTSGRPVDWTALHPTGRPRRVAMPGYPFGGDRVRLAAADAELAALGADGTTKSPLLTRHWVPADPVDRTAFPARTAVLAAPGTEKLALRLAAALPRAEVLTHDRLAADLADPATRWDRFDAVVDLAGCADPDPDADHARLTPWLGWLQRLVDHGRGGLCALLVSRDTETGTPGLGGAARAGLYRMLQSEYRHVRSRHVHVERHTSDEQLCRWVTDELGVAGLPADVAYRDGVRHRAELRELPDQQAGTLRFPDGHVLWVTGGTRGIGLLTARHFVARHGVRKLVLTGREELPPQAEWATHIAADTALGRRLRPLAELADQGVELEVCAVPLEERQTLAKTLAEVKLRLGPIGGVIHSAGFTDFDNPAFVRKPQTGMARVIGPKVFGLDALLECFRAEPLSLFVLYSSVAAAVPALAVGQSDYALANAYLDAVAEARPYGLPLVSVQWPSWKDTGAGEVRSAAYRSSGLAALSDEQGLVLLERAIASGARVVLPAVVRPDADWRPGRLTDHRPPTTDAAPETAASATRSGADPGPTAEAVRGAVGSAASWLLDRLAAELRFDRAALAGDVPIQDYGIDSILIAQLVQTAAKRLDVSLDPSALLEHPTADGFAEYLAERHEENLLAAFGGAAAADTPTSAARAAVVPAPHPAATVAQPARTTADIAVIGLSCRFPGARSAEEYWELLRQGRSALGPVSDRRFGRPLGYHAGLLPDVLGFDPESFLLSPADVAAMDPQALLLLEEVSNAVHQAGYEPAELKGRRIGVYVGGRATHTPDTARLERAANPVVVTGQNYLSANVSQFFDFRGPSLVVDTACSSALVAMDAAAQALRSGDIESAVVAGVSLLTDDRPYQVFGQRGLLNPGAEFHVFDRRGAGLVLGEGIGVVVLKPLDRARVDGDQVLAVLKGIAVNNDGRTAGPATPNLEAHKEVMTEALTRSGLSPQDVGWVEANGSGSAVTDLLELKAVETVYRAGSAQPVALGSVKPNIGHPLAAEGIASFIKVVLMLHHRQQAPFGSGQQPLEHFDLDASSLYFPRLAEPWPASAEAAAVSCFADGGTNAHLLLAPAPAGHRGTRTPLPGPEWDRRVVIRGAAEPTVPDAGLFWHDHRAPEPGAQPFWSDYRAVATRETQSHGR
ncbi:SDR family NAD(P)-dependent oxidoreductase [Streptomyces sp. NBC_00459]|uniref:SDR family NAD(P)-dependent oxidoreductase n=1 Tax=Streptomyces sp. NBC_00459 TaxID=2975749 RepID=UPI002E17B3BA